MVGGTSRIPALSDLLISEIEFPEHKLNKSVNEDEVVAAGAAVYAAKIAGQLEVISSSHISNNTFYTVV